MKKIIYFLHLWLGLGSGLVVFIIAITGCIYAFQAEIQEITQPYRHVKVENKTFIKPSELKTIADKELPGKHAHSVMYGQNADAAKVIYYSFEEHYYDFVYLNPYNGNVLRVKDEFSDFFRIVLDGHFYLWLPPKIGQPVVATSTLIFVILIISGIYMWWPKNKNGVRQRFSIKWKSKWKRKNYDLHNVLGFYISLLALVLALTGLIWGFEWFANGVYSIASNGKELLDYKEPLSKEKVIENDIPIMAEDILWAKVSNQYPSAKNIEVHFPETKESSIMIAVNPDNNTYYKIDYLYYDQYSLEEITVQHRWGKMKDATNGDMLMRMNYDIHVGAIAGLPGKFLAFFVSLIVATLPVTGFLIWFGRGKKKKPVTRIKMEKLVMAEA